MTVRTCHIFVSVTGQEDNIGDILLRRGLLRLIGPAATMHVFVQNMSKEFVTSLELAEGTSTYTDIRSWKAARLAAMADQTTKLVLLEKPGEIQESPTYYAQQLRVGLVSLALRTFRRGFATRLGVGFRHPTSQQFARWRRVLKFVPTAWRDSRSRVECSFGSSIPDLAYALAPHSPTAFNREARRPYLTVSMRAKDKPPSEGWLDGVRAAATNLALELRVVVQVGSDSEYCEHLARRLRCDLLPWAAGDNHASQETKLREVYRKSAVVISDRLHVLILAHSEGSSPLCITDTDNLKVQRHFDVVNMPGVAHAVHGSALAVERLVGDAFMNMWSAQDWAIAARAACEEAVASILGRPA